MRVWPALPIFVLLATYAIGDTPQGFELAQADPRAKCASYGFKRGTDGFANCLMQLDRQSSRPAESHDDIVRRYRKLSRDRQGDDRYPVCSASNMNAELDIEIGKWVGDDCQLAP
ncbi:hypothetical protein [Paracoccus laeviglucosivorans]|uniref:TrbM protein n=1 Tax=Paracoccus laeviglucosivorans TaxID=1197861 RepID=A0A521APK2_9RHOB|nr:hypothetical protein [Paracoccus laeviglucosivorans]SMO36725.1 hypothetical protein SAMN06265221_101247 [Paracoccus laeviglucosivorans]